MPEMMVEIIECCIFEKRKKNESLRHDYDGDSMHNHILLRKLFYLLELSFAEWDGRSDDCIYLTTLCLNNNEKL
jgi:uncharacterized protein YehS (DUF1456 family)